MGRILITTCMVVIFGLAMGESLPEKTISKMKVFENFLRALMNMDYKRSSTEEVVSSNFFFKKNEKNPKHF